MNLLQSLFVALVEACNPSTGRHAAVDPYKRRRGRGHVGNRIARKSQRDARGGLKSFNIEDSWPHRSNTASSPLIRIRPG